MRVETAARERSGSALLDVVVSLALLGLSGLAMIALVGQTRHSLRGVALAERETRLAAAELDRLVVYGRADLVAMIPQRAAHGWIVTVSQAAPDLFDIAIARSDTSPNVLRTTVYRPDTADAVTP